MVVIQLKIQENFLKNISLIDLYLQAESKFGINKLIKTLSVNRGTLERWKLLKDVPEYYLFDLYDLMGIDKSNK